MEKKRFSIVKKFPIFAIISLILIAPGLIGLVTLPFGLNLFNMDVDFVGGTSMTFNLHTEVTSEMSGEEIPQLVENACGVAPSTVQKTGENNESVLIKCTELDNGQQTAVVSAMQEKYSLTDEDTESVEHVNATIGREAQNKAVTAAVIAVLLMLLYITIRFEFTSGLAAVTCLAHDLLVILSAYIVLRIPFNTTFIAVALTILGYSINASIIVFDRIRENRRFARRESFEDTVEVSVWQTVRRTLFTSITTLLTIGMIFIFGVTSLRQFTLPIIIGIVAGGYSSIFLAGSLWAKYRGMLRKNRRAKASAKLASRDAGKPKTASETEESKADAPVPEAQPAPAAPAPASAAAPAQRRNNSKKNKRKKKKH